ncbi:hypothetical protein [Vibrio phage pTD1]|uniref:Uncharacterized protein n=1 Tax=Vibrio phage pTD1 TaxID=1938577 RepID=A0A1Q2U310_9CAUD|nr:hypothetical protein FDH33_gp112 [Vibrio phage pTD1]BAW98321.1 hypothetical protein [Vibrio phage pTD1]
MKDQELNIVLNLSINATYFPLFKDENALKYLANELYKEFNRLDQVLEHDEIPEWKTALLDDLGKVLMTEEEGQIFLSQIGRAYTEGYKLNESGTKKNLVYILFCKPQDVSDESEL